jgi:hypothetical protein
MMFPACQREGHTLLRVSELYTFKTGSSTSGSGWTHSGWAEEEALGASVMMDMLNLRILDVDEQSVGIVRAVLRGKVTDGRRQSDKRV